MYTHYSTPINTTPVYEPLSLEAIMQGNKAVYDRGEKNVQKIQGLIDSAYSLPSLQGKDTEVKNQIIQSYMDNVSQLAKGNLTDPKTAAQIESYISRVTRDPQIAGIVGRATFAASENKKREEAAAKNIEYLCPTCEEAQEYIQQGVFIADKKFNKTGFNNPEINKQVAEALKDVPKIKDHKIINGRLVEYERYDDSYAERIREVYAKPNTQMYMDYQFNKKYKDYDFDTEGVEDLHSKLETARSLQQTATQALRLNPKDVSAVNNLQEATTFLDRYESLIDDPNSLGDRYRERKRQYETQDQINRKITMEQFVSESSIKADEFALEDYRTKKDIAKDREKQILELEIASGVSRNTPDFFKVASTIIQTNKNKNAAAVAEGLNPDIKLKKQVPSGGYSPTYEQATEGLGNKKNEALPENRLPYHLSNILENENYFRSMMLSYYKTEQIDKIINTLKANKDKYNSGTFAKDILIKDKTMHVDPDGSENFSIPKDVLENLVNNQYNKTYGGEDRNKIEGGYENETYTMEELIKTYGSKELADSAKIKFNIKVK